MAATRSTVPRASGTTQKWTAAGTLAAASRRRAARVIRCAAPIGLPSGLLGQLLRGPALAGVLDLPLRVGVPRRKHGRDVEALLDDVAIVDLLERGRGTKGAVDRAAPAGPDQRAEVGLSGVHARAGGAARRAADDHERVTDRDHALPAAALEGRAVGVVEHADGHVAVPLHVLLLEHVEVRAPEILVARLPGGDLALEPLDLLVHGRAAVGEDHTRRPREGEMAFVAQDVAGDGDEAEHSCDQGEASCRVSHM